MNDKKFFIGGIMMNQVQEEWKKMRLAYQDRYADMYMKAKNEFNTDNHGALLKMSYVLINIFGLTSTQVMEIERNGGLTNADMEIKDCTSTKSDISSYLEAIGNLVFAFSKKSGYSVEAILSYDNNELLTVLKNSELLEAKTLLCYKDPATYAKKGLSFRLSQMRTGDGE